MSEVIRYQATGRESVGEHSLLCHGGIGFSIIEASAVWTPIVTYKVPGVTESMEDGKNGKLVEDGNERQMVESIRNITDQYPGPWVSSSIGQARKYSWDKTAFIWEKDLKAICE